MWHTRRRAVGVFLVWVLLASSSSTWATEMPEQVEAPTTNNSEQGPVWLPSSWHGWASFAAAGAGATAGVALQLLAIDAVMNWDLPVSQPIWLVLFGGVALSTVTMAAPMLCAAVAAGLVGGVKGMVGASVGGVGGAFVALYAGSAVGAVVGFVAGAAWLTANGAWSAWGGALIPGAWALAGLFVGPVVLAPLGFVVGAAFGAGRSVERGGVWGVEGE